MSVGDVREETKSGAGGRVYYAPSGLPHLGGPSVESNKGLLYTMGSGVVRYLPQCGRPIDIEVADVTSAWEQKKNAVFVVSATSQAQAAKIAGYYGFLMHESGALEFISRGHAPSEESTLKVSENGKCAFAATGFECQLDETGRFDGEGVSVRCVIAETDDESNSRDAASRGALGCVDERRDVRDGKCVSARRRASAR